MPRKFRPEIQLLRTMAVLTVVIYHLNPAWLPGGFVGVDVFFVISGFLITARMFKEVASTGRISLLTFWTNRARRILPAATIAIVVTALVSPVFLPVTQLTSTAWQGLASALYFQNFVLASRSVDYLTQAQADTPFQHFWSLSVEEQFYLVWPLLVLGAAWLTRTVFTRTDFHTSPRRLRFFSAVLFGVFALVCAASLAGSVHLVGEHDPRAYFLTPVRVWELGAGGLLAIVLRDTHRWPVPRTILALCGYTAIISAAVFYSSATAFPGLTALVPVVGCLAVIAAGRTEGPGSVNLIVDWRPTQVIGNWSYSLYLWHFPVVVFFTASRDRHPGVLEAAVLLGLSIALAAASYYFVENPIRLSSLLRSRRWLTAIAGVTTMCLSAVVALVPQASYAIAEHRSQEQQEQFLASPPPNFAWRSLRPDGYSVYADERRVIVPSLATALNDQPRYSCANVPQGAETNDVTPCVAANPRGSKTIAVVGDSHASMMVPAIRKAVEGTNWKVVVYLHNSCPFSLAPRGYETNGRLVCTAVNRRTLKTLVDDKPDTVFTTNLAVNDFQAHGSEKEPGTWGFEQTLRPLSEAGIPVYTLRQTPSRATATSFPDCVASHLDNPSACDLPRSEARLNSTSARALQSAVTAVNASAGSRAAEVSLLDFTKYLCTDTVCPAVVGSALVYRDDNHVSRTYAQTLIPIVKKEMGID